MTTEIKKEGEFDPGCVTDVYDKLHAHNYALRAFGTLLQSSHLDDFTDEGLATKLSPEIDTEAQNLRWGLSQILELYLDKQEKILSEYCDQYHKSDIFKTKSALNTICAFEQRAWSTQDAAVNSLRETIADLDIVINRNGELKEKAASLKETCMQHLKRITDKEASAGNRAKESPRTQAQQKGIMR